MLLQCPSNGEVEWLETGFWLVQIGTASGSNAARRCRVTNTPKSGLRSPRPKKKRAREVQNQQVRYGNHRVERYRQGEIRKVAWKLTALRIVQEASAADCR
jgi:hypothetical protein